MSELSQTDAQQLLDIQETKIKATHRFYVVNVGEALLQIKSQKLYELKFKTFEDYCRKVWNWSDDYARKHIRAAAIAANLKSCGVETLPIRESQFRELSAVDQPALQVEAWIESLKASDVPMAKDVRAAVDLVQQRTNTVTKGSVALVTAGDHVGSEVVIDEIKSNGAIAVAKLPNGKKFPFLVGELDVLSIAPIQPRVVKPSLKDENAMLKQLVMDIISQGWNADIEQRVKALL